MPLPTIGDALAQLHRLAEEEEVEISRNAAKDIDGLKYFFGDVCDMLFDLEEFECEKIDSGDWPPHDPVLTFKTSFCPNDKEEADVLFVEVSVRPESLYVLACKLDGSPR